MQIGQAGFFSQPLRQRFQAQEFARTARVFPFLIGDDDQRMDIGAAVAPVRHQLFRIFFWHQLVGNQVANQLRQRQRTVALRLCCRDGGHGC
jgi:hypothetical protein